MLRKNHEDWYMILCANELFYNITYNTLLTSSKYQLINCSFTILLLWLYKNRNKVLSTNINKRGSIYKINKILNNVVVGWAERILENY